MAAGDLTTLATVKDWLGIPSGDTSKDARLSRLITSSSARIVGWLGRGILSASYSETYSGVGNARLGLRNYPVIAIASLTVDGVTVPAASGSPPAGGYTVAHVGSPVVTGAFINLSGYCFTRGADNVAPVYTAGYATVPADIEQAAIELVQTILGRQSVDQNVSSESVSGVGSVSYRQGSGGADDCLLSALNGGALLPYRRVAGF